ncbi:hypothetical protein VOLCADRAFT_89535 [Volvox carteri f. nagariensis]|uniref:Peroxisomal membrane protein n=1 Tax=Volvox carteri f. nagariensis TaxID=3068 RepID=D8TS36_VOLCA|nr:uncharacterized protein VOLCADRAFT_89535 [Volvox carteri f. nagariensis]EFJ49757.1 hypothetical protein VOLCADRAFT_89535 [Volvox carteri f. nagariensis]|eukprot:XP_002949264.1 hypothetical protein VOLCADRAFT_89535 [Volvox carteri f. nagariensis]
MSIGSVPGGIFNTRPRTLDQAFVIDPAVSVPKAPFQQCLRHQLWRIRSPVPVLLKLLLKRFFSVGLRARLLRQQPHRVPLLLVIFAREPLISFWAFYCLSLDSHPLLTKVATGVVGAILGDYVAQKISYQREVQEAKLHGKPAPPFAFDVMRTSRLAIYGALVGTPHIMPEAMTCPQAVLTKMIMDQVLMSPASTALFFVVMRCWEGHSKDAVPYMLVKMVPTLKANYLLWPIAHIINFAFVPPTQRILYCNAVGLVWTVILSTILNSSTPSTSQSVSATSGSSGLAMGTADTAGSSAGFSVSPQQLREGRKGVPQPGIAATAFVRPVQWDVKSKDA